MGGQGARRHRGIQEEGGGEAQGQAQGRCGEAGGPQEGGGGEEGREGEGQEGQAGGEEGCQGRQEGCQEEGQEGEEAQEGGQEVMSSTACTSSPTFIPTPVNRTYLVWVWWRFLNASCARP